MLTIDGLFGAGDTVGGSAHKFSSGSFTEGRLAAKAAVKYIKDQKHPIVIKADGLAAGKGVVVSNSIDESSKAIDNLLASERH